MFFPGWMMASALGFDRHENCINVERALGPSNLRTHLFFRAAELRGVNFLLFIKTPCRNVSSEAFQLETLFASATSDSETGSRIDCESHKSPPDGKPT